MSNDLAMIGKRLFDFTVALLILILVWPFLLICIVIAGFDTKSIGIFKQVRIGQFGNHFKIYKLQTMYRGKDISKIGYFFRKYKIDELPQIVNVLKGEMSLVGPRPDVPGYYDQLVGDDRKLLHLKPGITGLASLVYKNEEEILSKQSHPNQYNNEVIFPDKIKWNLLYQEKYSFMLDIKILFHTVFGGFPNLKR